jgi:hypothetical protein
VKKRVRVHSLMCAEQYRDKECVNWHLAWGLDKKECALLQVWKERGCLPCFLTGNFEKNV